MSEIYNFIRESWYGDGGDGGDGSDDGCGVTCISFGTVGLRPPWSWMVSGVTCLEYYYCSGYISQPGSPHIMVWPGLETAGNH